MSSCKDYPSFSLVMSVQVYAELYRFGLASKHRPRYARSHHPQDQLDVDDADDDTRALGVLAQPVAVEIQEMHEATLIQPDHSIEEQPPIIQPQTPVMAAVRDDISEVSVFVLGDSVLTPQEEVERNTKTSFTKLSANVKARAGKLRKAASMSFLPRRSGKKYENLS